MFRRTVFSMAAVILGLGLCIPGASRAQDERLQVVASFSILADVARNVAGDAADVSSLMPLGAGPHGYVPTPQDLVALAEADVIFLVGANFEEGLSEAIENAGEAMNIVVASDCVAIQPFGGGGEREPHEDDEAQEGAHNAVGERCEAHRAELEGLGEHEREGEEHDHAPTLGMLYAIDCGGAHEGGGESTHEAGSCDPHVWTDPHNVMLWTLMIRDTLSALDPANAEVYAANAAAYIEDLETLADATEAAIATIPEANRRLVTNHLAYGYYANRFGLAMVGTVIPAASDLAEPSAAEIAALIEAIAALDVPAVFADSTANPDLAQQVAEETGAAFYTLYTGSLTDADGPAATYLDYMRTNTRIIVEALGGTVE